jgi:hypothetical protein
MDEYESLRGITPGKYGRKISRTIGSVPFNRPFAILYVRLPPTHFIDLRKSRSKK